MQTWHAIHHHNVKIATSQGNAAAPDLMDETHEIAVC